MSLLLPRVVLLAASVTLAVAIANLFHGDPKSDASERQRKPPAVTAHRVSLVELFSDNPHAISTTTIETNHVQKLIGADEIFNRRFSDGNVELEVYVAHWTWGNMYASEGKRHIPDHCWVSAGWTLEGGRSFRTLDFAGSKTKPAEWRRFSLPTGDKQEALYWCLVDGRLYDYARRSSFPLDDEPSKRSAVRNSMFLRFWWEKFLAEELDVSITPGQADVYFIRVNSRSFDNLGANKMVAFEMRALAKLGLSLETDSSGTPRSH